MRDVDCYHEGVIFVNFKTYQEGTGETAAKLARICAEAAESTGVAIIPVVQTADIWRLKDSGLKVWAQHIDDIEYGPNTGQTSPEAVMAAGAKGTLLNHSENKLPVEVIGSLVKKAKGLGLKVLVCAESVDEGQQIAKLGPDFLAYEPPELIGGNVSVSTAKPGIIRDFVFGVAPLPVLVGAGIHTRKDVAIALTLGAKGVLVSSAVVLAKNPKEKLLELASGFK